MPCHNYLYSKSEKIMHKFLLLVFSSGIIVFLAGPVAAERPYFYPYINPFEATVMEVPSIYETDLPREVPTKIFQIKTISRSYYPRVILVQQGFDLLFGLSKAGSPAGLYHRWHRSTLQLYKNDQYAKSFLSGWLSCFLHHITNTHEFYC